MFTSKNILLSLLAGCAFMGAAYAMEVQDESQAELSLAAANGQMNKIHDCVAAGALPSVEDLCVTVTRASYTGDFGPVELLIRYGAPINVSGIGGESARVKAMRLAGQTLVSFMERIEAQRNAAREAAPGALEQ